MLRLDHPLWQAAHRPLFFCAGLAALFAPAVWLWPGGVGADPLRWHLHELLFGMGGAAVGGYLLTALPSWTGAGRVGPQSVRALTLLWCMARLALPLAESLPFELVLALALAYFAVLALILAGQLIAARLWRRLWLLGMIAGMALGDAAVLADKAAAPLAMVLLFAVLISSIGGRAVPAFTRSWVQQTGAARPIQDSPLLSATAISATVLGAGLAMAGQDPVAAACFLLAGVLHLARMLGWRCLQTRAYPALLLLHLAWIWLPVGLILIAAALLHPEWLPLHTALHALTMGAMGTMILAIAGRAAMARRAGKLIAGHGLATAFALVWLAACLRIASAAVPQGWPDPIILSAGVWMLGWAVFLWSYRPALRGAVPWPVLSANLNRGQPAEARGDRLLTGADQAQF